MSRQKPPLTSYPQLMRPKEVAEAIGVSQSTLSYWRRSGTGPIKPVICEARVIRYARADLRRLIEARR